MNLSSSSFDPASIQAVVFDAYGTLFKNLAPVDYWFAKELLERQSIQADAEALELSIREAWAQASPWGLARPWAAGTPTTQASDFDLQLNGPVPQWLPAFHIWRRQYEIAFAAHGLNADPEEAASYLREFLANLDPFPDAHETLERLASWGLLLGLLSNADEDFLQRAVSRARLRFSVIQSSESLRVYKPHRSAFIATCSRLNCEPDRVLYVGDSPTADVLGARNAGLRTAWLRGDSQAWPAHLPSPDVQISSLAELIPLMVPVSS